MRMKTVFLGLLVFVLALGMVFPTAAMAVSPGQGGAHPVKGEDWVPPGQQDKGLPPGLQDKDAPPGLEDKGGLPPGLKGRETLPSGIRMRFWQVLKQLEEVDEEEIASIAISGEESIVLPQEDDEKPFLLQYTALVQDQFGRTLEDETVTWAVESDDFTDIEIDQSGEVTISEPGEGEFTVTVKADSDSEIEKELQVTLYFPAADAVQITGAEAITIPEEDEVVTENYSAVVVDQHGFEMEDKDKEFLFLWIMVDDEADEIDVTGVTLEPEDELSAEIELKVESGAEETTFTLLVIYDVDDEADEKDVFYVFDVELVKGD